MTRNLAVLLCLMLTMGCATRPAKVEKTVAQRLQDPLTTSLGQLTASQAKVHGGKSGIILLDSGRQAFTSRVALAGRAQRTLDAQYYIWNADKTGRILAERILSAAEQGVRVRLLLDDYGVGNKDNGLIALTAHPNIDVRVYNPFNAGFRSGVRKWMNFLVGFRRLNRRMHSKTFIVDNSLAIVGGRNIGDEYFDASEEMNHRDRELLAMGPVVESVSQQFDVMWNSEWSIPIGALTSVKLSEQELEERYSTWHKFADTKDNQPYPLPLTVRGQQALIDGWLEKALWAPAEFVYNPPAITAGDEKTGTAVADSLLTLLAQAKAEVLIESAYFTLMDEMLEKLAPLVQRELKINVLTNSLASTDVWTIHAGYTRNRKELLKKGVGLYEFRTDANSCETQVDNNHLNCTEFKYSLHAKSVVFDRKLVFVGSFNLNPRSQLLNTETALIIDSPALASEIARDIETNMQPQNSWQVALNERNKLEWHGTVNGKEQVIRHEPATSSLSRFKSATISLLPLEKYW
ncbi:MAG: phospholipase D-like domain-containing protein [Pseudomonadales bacterium]